MTNINPHTDNYKSHSGTQLTFGQAHVLRKASLTGLAVVPPSARPTLSNTMAARISVMATGWRALYSRLSSGPYSVIKTASATGRHPGRSCSQRSNVAQNVISPLQATFPSPCTLSVGAFL
jgi:hypothetical protein